MYGVDGDLYFAVKADPAFGGISGYDAEQMRALFAERGGDPDRPGKRDPLDCLLWQAERPGEPAWDSPFGRGRPGWHVECAAIALEHLGMTIDVQGGGTDLVFPHHEMSASEAQVATGSRPFARAYVHQAMVGLDGEKMSKSKGNLVLVSTTRDSGVDPMAIRLALLGAPLPHRLVLDRRRAARRGRPAGPLAYRRRQAVRSGRHRTARGGPGGAGE